MKLFPFIHHALSYRIIIILVYFIGPVGWPLIGDVPMFLKNFDKIHNLVVDLHKQYGKIVALRFGPKLFVFVNDFNLMKKVCLYHCSTTQFHVTCSKNFL